MRLFLEKRVRVVYTGGDVLLGTLREDRGTFWVWNDKQGYLVNVSKVGGVEAA